MPQLIDDPREQTTAATDALITLVAAGYAWHLRDTRSADPWKANLWIATLTGVAASGALGATIHGFQISEETRQRLWAPLYLLLGLVVALFASGATRDGWGERAARRALPALLLSALGFFIASRRLPGGFRLFLAYEAMAMLFALGVYARLAREGRLQGARLMAAGVLINIVAAAVQASPLDATILGVPFDHNGLFHLVQITGIPVIVAGLRADLASEQR